MHQDSQPAIVDKCKKIRGEWMPRIELKWGGKSMNPYWINIKNLYQCWNTRRTKTLMNLEHPSASFAWRSSRMGLKYAKSRAAGTYSTVSALWSGSRVPTRWISSAVLCAMKKLRSRFWSMRFRKKVQKREESGTMIATHLPCQDSLHRIIQTRAST